MCNYDVLCTSHAAAGVQGTGLQGKNVATGIRTTTKKKNNNNNNNDNNNNINDNTAGSKALLVPSILLKLD